VPEATNTTDGRPTPVRDGPCPCGFFHGPTEGCNVRARLGFWRNWFCLRTDGYGWPIEQVRGRHVGNLIRRAVLLARKWAFLY
jgi:hypothetical protein